MVSLVGRLDRTLWDKLHEPLQGFICDRVPSGSAARQGLNQLEQQFWQRWDTAFCYAAVHLVKVEI